MSSQARTRTADAMVGASSLCMLVAGVSMISPDVRTQLANATAADLGGQLHAVMSRALDYGHLIAGVARDYGLENSPVAGFAILGVVLVVVMFRT